jgi:hypothetical protein
MRTEYLHSPQMQRLLNLLNRLPKPVYQLPNWAAWLIVVAVAIEFIYWCAR